MAASTDPAQTSRQITVIVFESFSWPEALGLYWHKFVMGRPVYIVEPFHAFHHRHVKVRFFQKPWTAFIKNLIDNKTLLVIPAKDIGSSQNYPQACEQAVEKVERIAGKVGGHKTALYSLSAALMGEETAARVFKTNLVNQLAEYFSVRDLIVHIQERFKGSDIVFSPSYQVGQYVMYEKILDDHARHLQFYGLCRFNGRVSAFFRQVKNVLFTVYHIGFYFLKCFAVRPTPGAGVLNAKIGVVLLSWDRQLENHQKSLSFLVDKKSIADDDIVFFCAFQLTPTQRMVLAERSVPIIEVKQTPVSWKDLLIWCRMLICAMGELFDRDDYLTKDFLLAIKNFLVWKNITPLMKLSHFVTHADCGVGMLGRNRALKLAGIETWYFTDSVNQLYNFSTEQNKPLRHPFYCYLNYDHLVTWTKFLAQYFQAHPGSFEDAHVAGCLWADYIVTRREMELLVPPELLSKVRNKFIIAAFDSTYSCNGLTSYEEGLAFAQDIIKIAECSQNVCILWREKKKRSFHLILDGEYGPQLLDLYKKIDQHPRIINVSQSLGSGEMISLADLTVSFPYTSTSFEALSAGRQAVWHDAQGRYGNSFFVPPQALTHSFAELSGLIEKLQKDPRSHTCQWVGAYQDPYRDHHAIDRFRDLLRTKR